MFLLAPSLAPPLPNGTGDPPLYTAMTVVGLLLWVAAGVTAILRSSISCADRLVEQKR
jgi:hypothetical protein